MVYFVGAGSGAADLITVRGMHMLQQADVIIYAGSLVNPELLEYARADCEIHNSAHLTLEEVLKLMQEAQAQGKMLVRLHTGEPSIYGAVREQMDALDELGIPYESCPGVSACFGAAASLNLEYTLPGVSQTLIITRMEGRTGVPQKESIESLAAHHASMAIYLSTGMLRELSHRLILGGYAKDTPRSPCLQGNLAGGRDLYLYGGDTGTGSGRTWHQKDSTGTGGGCYHPWKLSEVAAVCGGFYHRIPSGKMLCHTGRGNAGGAA